VVLAALAFALGISFERYRGGPSSSFDAQIAALIPVSEFYRADDPTEAAKRISHIYHISLLNLARLSKEQFGEEDYQKLELLIRPIIAGRQKAGLPSFDPNHFTSEMTPSVKARIEEILK